MKILNVMQIHWYNAEVQYAIDLGRRMADAGHEVHCLTRPDSWASERVERAGLTLHTEDGFNAKGFKSWKTLPAVWNFRRLLKRERFDAVIIHRSEAMALIAFLCRLHGIPVIRVRGDMRPVRSNFLNRWIYGKLLDAVVTSNKKIAASIENRLGVKARVIYGGVDQRLFLPDGPGGKFREELGFSPDDFLVGILGRMDPVKGHLDLLEAASLVLRKVENVGFVIMIKSDHEPLPEVRAYIKDDPILAERVRIVGHRSDLPSDLKEFSLGVVASRGSEANCRVGLEWMASGVPLLATKVGVLPEIIDDNITGSLVEIASPFEMAEKIVYLAQNPEEAALQGRQARKRVEELFTLDLTARTFIELTTSLVEYRIGRQ